MTVCHRCSAESVKDLGTHGYCGVHLGELFERFDPAAFAMNGLWMQDGPMRPDHGPNHAECRCLACGATAVAPTGTPCNYCATARERMTEWQTELNERKQRDNAAA